MTLPERLLTSIRERQARVDDLTPQLRALVHEHGWGVVNAFLQLGVKKPQQIQHLIMIVRQGAVETQEHFPEGTVLPPAAVRMQEVVRDLGIQNVSPRLLVAAIRRRGGVVMPMSPVAYMIETSIGALHQPRYADVQVPRWEKHQIRLHAVLHKAAEVEMEMPAERAVGGGI